MPASQLAVTEGASADFTVVLDSQPTASVTLTVSVPDGSGLTPTPASLTFNASGDDVWNTPQTVTVAAGEDDDVDDASVKLALTASGAEFAGVTGELTVNVSDDDDPGLVFAPAKDSTIDVDEGGSATFNVRLDKAPSIADGFSVTFTQPASGTGVTLDTDAAAAGNQTGLTFNAGNWQRGLDVTVRAAQDGDTDDESATIRATWTGQATAESVLSIAVEDAGAPVQLAGLPGPLVTISEGDSLTVGAIRLASAPSGTVTLTFTSSDTDNVTLDTDPSTSGDQSTLTFTATDWSTPKSIALTAVPDSTEFADATETVSISATATGGYSGLMGSFRVLNRDAGIVGLTLSSQGAGHCRGRDWQLHGAAGGAAERGRPGAAGPDRLDHRLGDPGRPDLHQDRLEHRPDRVRARRQRRRRR